MTQCVGSFEPYNMYKKQWFVPTVNTVSKYKSAWAVVVAQLEGQWSWCSWQSGRFQYQRTRVRIQSSATFIGHLFTVN